MKKKVEKHIEKKDSVIESADKKILKNTEELSAAIEHIVADELFKFDTKNGKLVGGKSSPNYPKILKLINKVDKEIKKGAHITDYLKSFDEIEAINSDIHTDLNNIEIDINKISRYKQELVNDIIDQLTGSGMDVNFIQPARQMLFKNVTLGSPISELSKQLKEYIIGTPEKPGQLSRYATQITRDAVSQYDGAINQMVRDEFQMDAIMYVGSVIKD